MTHPWVMDNNCVKYYLDPAWQWGVMVRTWILGMCTVTLNLGIWPWVKIMTHLWVMDNNCVKYYPDSTVQWGVIAQTPILGMSALWPWPWRYDLVSRSWHTLESQLCEILSRLVKGVISYGPDKMWTDRRTDRVIPIYPPTLFAGGIKTCLSPDRTLPNALPLRSPRSKLIIWANRQIGQFFPVQCNF